MPNTRTHAPRGALVFDMRQLGRQAGSALTQTRIVPAPEDLRLELIGVPVGAATAPRAGEGARCLPRLTSSVTASFQELFLYADGRRDSRDRHDKHDRH